MTLRYRNNHDGGQHSRPAVLTPPTRSVRRAPAVAAHAGMAMASNMATMIS